MTDSHKITFSLLNKEKSFGYLCLFSSFSELDRWKVTQAVIMMGKKRKKKWFTGKSERNSKEEP